MPVQFHAEQLDTPTHRFDYTNPSVTNSNVGIGLGRNGPFDSSTARDFTDATFTFVYPESWRSDAEGFEDALINGHSNYYPNGFKSFFRMDSVSVENTIELDDTDLRTYVDAVSDIQAADDDLAIVFVSDEMRSHGYRSPYWSVKALLAQAGIPSQMVLVDKLRRGSPHYVQLKYLIVNVVSQIYAKLGGTPWVIHRHRSPFDLVIGVGKSEYWSDRVGGTRRTLGFASAYQSNGAFLWYDSTRATTSRRSFNDQLTDSIVEAAEKYAQREMNPENIVVHSYKRIGPAERDARDRLESQFDGLDVTLAHLNDSHDFRIYDDRHQSGLSERGLWIQTGGDKGFVMTGGRRKYRPGSPVPIELQVEGSADIEEIAQGIYDLCSVYWKDQFGSNMPITIKYAEDIADIVENAQKIDAEGVASIDIDRLVNPRLRDIPWFL
jgi:argonaute-like protein implicated in RNA metabolism and viral defense